MSVTPRFQALAAIAVLGGLGLWLVLQVTGSPGGVPEHPAPGGEGERLERVPIPLPETVHGVTDLEVAVEVRTRARVLPPTPSPEARILGLAGDRVSRVRILTRPWGRALVELTLSAGGHVYRLMDLEDPQPLIWPKVDLRGRVVDDAGEPVRGAEVWYGQAHGGELHTVTTDRNGAFEVPSLVGGRGVPLVVTAPGRVSRYRVLNLDGFVSPEPLFVLGPGVPLRVRIAADMWTDQVRVFLAPQGVGDTDQQQFPFFLGALGNGWEIQDNGSVTIQGLSAGSLVEVIVHHPLAVTPSPRSVRLFSGSRGAGVTVPLIRRRAWTGRVVDSNGLPIAGALVVSLRGGQELPRRPRHTRRWLLPPETGMVGVAHDRTRADGGFAVVKQGVLRITAPGYAGLELFVQGAASSDIVLYEPQVGEPTLRIHVPDCSNDYEIRCRPYVNEWRTLACGAPFTLELPEPSVVDISVQIRRDGVVSEPRVFIGLVVQGLTELDLR